MSSLTLVTKKLSKKESPDNKSGWTASTLIVVQSSNNFGDQNLTFCDHTTGVFRKFEHVEYEGNWQDFTKPNMLKLAKCLKII